MIPASTTPVEVASSGYSGKSSAAEKGKAPLSGLHFKKNAGNTYTGSTVKPKPSHPFVMRSSNSFSPLDNLEEITVDDLDETTVDEQLAADLLGVDYPNHDQSIGGNVSSSEPSLASRNGPWASVTVGLNSTAVPFSSLVAGAQSALGTSSSESPFLAPTTIAAPTVSIPVVNSTPGVPTPVTSTPSATAAVNAGAAAATPTPAGAASLPVEPSASAAGEAGTTQAGTSASSTSMPNTPISPSAAGHASSPVASASASATDAMPAPALAAAQPTASSSVVQTTAGASPVGPPATPSATGAGVAPSFASVVTSPPPPPETRAAAKARRDAAAAAATASPANSQSAAAAVQAQPAVMVQAQPTVMVQPQPVAVAQPQPAVVVQPQPAVVAQPQPILAVQPPPIAAVQLPPTGNQQPPPPAAMQPPANVVAPIPAAGGPIIQAAAAIGTGPTLALVGAAQLDQGGAAVSMWMPEPMGGDPPIYGWDEDCVHENMHDRQITKWGSPPDNKFFIYEWDGRRHNDATPTVETLKGGVGRALNCPPPLIGPAEPSNSSITSTPFLYLVRNLTDAQIQRLLARRCWSGYGTTFFAIPYAPPSAPFLGSIRGLLYSATIEHAIEVATLVAVTIRDSHTAQAFLALVNDNYPAGVDPMTHLLSSLRVTAVDRSTVGSPAQIIWNATAEPPSLIASSNRSFVKIFQALEFDSDMYYVGKVITPALVCSGCKSFGHDTGCKL
ncbi:hypothetical protein B0H19DRAFT_1085288 [Mycena capillaripes]|nr:hypothetical protein B0H19DRAFT_1085288 [Mycena capillaripes]